MYALGTKSLANLKGVHPNLVSCVQEAIKLSTQDFGVHEGLRTLETQAEYMKCGVTRTMDSKHLKQADGFGHAVDLVPYLDGKLRWEWPLIYPIASAMQKSAQKFGLKLRWGGVWDRVLTQLSEDFKQDVADYCVRHPGPDFLDGPHYELVM